MKNKILLTLLFVIQIFTKANAQDYFSLFNLGDFVVQTQNISPVYLPEKTFSYALPINLNVNYAGGFKASDFIKNGDINPNNIKLDFSELIASAKSKNNVNFDFSFNLFMLGFKTNHGSVTLFSNIKSTTNWQYSKDFLKIAASGFTSSNLSNDKLLSNLYHEIGIGMTRRFLDNKLAIGLRIKYLNGMVNYSTAKDAQFALEIDEETSIWTVNSNNAEIQTSGFSLEKNEVISLFTNNTGIGFDFGATYILNPKWEFEIAMNDIGHINWKENVNNYQIKNNSNKQFTGIDIDNGLPSNIGEEIEHIVNDFLDPIETTNNYKSSLATNTYLSAKYKLSDQNVFSSILYNNFVFDRLSPSIAFGYNRIVRNYNVGAVVSTQDNSNKIRFGTNFAVNLGKFQLYAAVDNLFGMMKKMEEATNANFHFGFNLVFDKRY